MCKHICCFIFIGNCYWYIINEAKEKSGESTELWGTPCVMGGNEDTGSLPSTTVVCVRSEIYDDINSV